MYYKALYSTLYIVLVQNKYNNFILILSLIIKFLDLL